MRVTVEIPAGRVTFGVTRMSYRTLSGELLGDVPFEPSLVRVRVQGQVMRLPREYVKERS